MRSSVVIAVALAAAAAPSLAAPSAGYPNTYAKRQTSDLFARSTHGDALLAREVQDLLARGFWQDFGHGFKQGFVGTIKTLAPIIPAFLKREELEALMAREGLTHEDLMARGFWSDFGHGFKEGFVGTIKTLAPIVPALLRRSDFEELFTRDDMVARGFWSDFGQGFKQGFVGTIKTLAPIIPAFLKREDIEMMAREAMIEHASRDDIFERSAEDKFAEGYKKAVLLALRHFNPEASHYIEPPHLDLLAQHAAHTHAARSEYDILMARGFWHEVGDTLKQAGQAILPIVPDLVKAWRGKRGLDAAELESLIARGFWSEAGDTLKQAGEAILPIVPDLIKAWRGKRALDSPELLARQFEYAARSIAELD
jgi:hypothetical protein